jgi:hypothetical protein
VFFVGAIETNIQNRMQSKLKREQNWQGFAWVNLQDEANDKDGEHNYSVFHAGPWR